MCSQSLRASGYLPAAGEAAGTDTCPSTHLHQLPNAPIHYLLSHSLAIHLVVLLGSDPRTLCVPGRDLEL